MIENLDEHLIGIAIGVRYRANFSIEDQLGKIVDEILYSKNAFFNPEVFPRVITNVKEKVLINETTDDRLVINSSNVILEISFGETFQRDDLDSIVKAFSSHIIDGILKEHKVKAINRVGFIKRYLLKDQELADSFIRTTIGSTLEGINDINLRFSKKVPEMESLVKVDVNDYYNAIFNVIKRADKNELFISIDYQKYFDPFLETPSQIGFEDFYNQATSFNNKNCLNWLNQNYGVLV